MIRPRSCVCARRLTRTWTSALPRSSWRNSDGRQALLARFLRTVEIVVTDLDLARRAGELLGRSATADAIDAMVVLVAEDEDAILTTDPDDIAHLAAAARIRAAVIAC